ncbi:MAG: small-conductance mechanosensitive channel, partial [halophilic archaeon J07HX5]
MMTLGAVANQQIVASLVISLVVLVLVWRVDRLVDRYTGAPQQTVTELREFRRVATATIVIAALSWSAEQPVPGWLAEGLETTGTGQLWTALVSFLPSSLVAERVAVFVTLLSTWWAWKFRSVGDGIIERAVARQYDETLAPIVENVWDVGVVVVLILALLDIWGISVTALLAPAGLLGIAVGFAARESIANFFGSIALYADETYERGDFIELENGTAGTVRD